MLQAEFLYLLAADLHRERLEAALERRRVREIRSRDAGPVKQARARLGAWLIAAGERLADFEPSPL